MALVLSRKLMETICVGDDVTITVVRICGDKIRLAIEAPADVSVDRLEVREAKRRDAKGGAA